MLLNLDGMWTHAHAGTYSGPNRPHQTACKVHFSGKQSCRVREGAPAVRQQRTISNGVASGGTGNPAAPDMDRTLASLGCQVVPEGSHPYPRRAVKCLSLLRFD